MGNPNWVPGHSAPGAGRQLGSRNRRTTDAINAIISAGHQDPLLTLAELQAKSTDEGIRATAANMLAPFMHSKCGAMPPLRFISEPIELPFPNPITLEEINANTSYLDQALAAGTLDIDFHTALLAGQRQHIESIKARGDDNLGDQVIRISRWSTRTTRHQHHDAHFVTSMTAPIASGWSGCRVGLAPTGKRRLCTALAKLRSRGL